MKNVISFLAVSAMVIQVAAQPVAQKLSTAFASFEKDPQLRSALSSLYVVEATTGNVIFEKNATIGLAPASTQKIITAATAYEVLGTHFRYETRFGYWEKESNGKLESGLVVKPSGDPTLGSWRWPATSESVVMKRVLGAVQKKGFRSFSTSYVDEGGWESEGIPGGWIWNDIGNYYGAGAGALNWRENQYDLVLKSGTSIGDAVKVVKTEPQLYNITFDSRVTAAARGTGDNSYIYLPIGNNVAMVRGTIPAGEDRFTISGAMPAVRQQFFSTLYDTLQQKGITPPSETFPPDISSLGKVPAPVTYFHTEVSPHLDSIVFWFLRKSVNLYGEALAKTIAFQKGKTASSEHGAGVIREFWKNKDIGIHASELNMQDGSGLSPQNRVTTHAQVAVLLYAKKQPWFSGFYNALPEYNGMKLKSGTIGGTKGYCGYYTTKEGRQYVVSFLVNNYNGSSSALVQKMYKVLDVLK